MKVKGSEALVGGVGMGRERVTVGLHRAGPCYVLSGRRGLAKQSRVMFIIGDASALCQ